MATNVFFDFIDNSSNALVGSRVSLRAWTGPYFSGSFPNQIKGTANIPLIEFTDVSGSVTYPNVIPGIYKVSWTGPNANNPQIYVNYAETVEYVSIIETNGGTQNGFDYIVETIPTGSVCPNVPNALSASYALTASFALNGGGGGGGTQVSCSYASSSLSSSYALTSSNTTMYPDIYDINGQVGIGTKNFLAELTVNGEIAEAGGAYFFGTGGDDSFLGAGGNFGVNKNPDFTLDVAGDINLSGVLRQNGNPFTASYLPNITDDTVDQYIGINQKSPAFNLDINGKISGSSSLGNSAGLLTIQPNNGFGISLLGNSNGGANVGIGTLTPANRLDVIGNISCSVITGSLYGTSSVAISSSLATSASIALNAYQINLKNLNTEVFTNAGNISITTNAGNVALQSGGTGSITMNTSNNVTVNAGNKVTLGPIVGINQSNPMLTLDVNGTIGSSNGPLNLVSQTTVIGFIGSASALTVSNQVLIGTFANPNSNVTPANVSNGCLYYQDTPANPVNLYAWSTSSMAWFSLIS